MKTKIISKSLFFIVITVLSFSLNTQAQSVSGDWYTVAEIQGLSVMPSSQWITLSANCALLGASSELKPAFKVLLAI